VADELHEHVLLLERLREADDAGLQRDVEARQPVRLTGAVPALVLAADTGRDVGRKGPLRDQLLLGMEAQRQVSQKGLRFSIWQRHLGTGGIGHRELAKQLDRQQIRHGCLRLV